MAQHLDQGRVSRFVRSAAVCGVALAVVAFSGAGCSSRSAGPQAAGPARIPQVSGPALAVSSMNEGSAQIVRLSNGAEIRVARTGGALWMEMQGVLTDTAFGALVQNAARDSQKLAQELGKTLERLEKRGALVLQSAPEVGFFSALVPYEADTLNRFKGLELPYAAVLNPAVVDRTSLDEARAHRLSEEGLSLARSSTEAFSGLSRMGVLEFVQLAQRDIGGEPINGSQVRVGITDTGITYNHPTFRSQKDPSKVRIDYMRDFTREGRVYFNPSAKFTVAPGRTSPQHLVISGQLIDSVALPATPPADDFSESGEVEILPSAELAAALAKSDTLARIGVLNEAMFNSPSEEVDFNHNGKLDDQLLVLFVREAGKEDSAYIQWNGTSDFRNVKPLRDFNTTGDLATVFSEKIGFDFRTEALATLSGAKVPVLSVSIVGFDPGNHGSHVAGIAAGSKTILNDTATTLARGVAPEAQIAMNRVCANQVGCNALNAVVDLATRAHVDVINMSLGGLNPFNDGYGVEELTYNRLTQIKNVLFMISAGNSGPMGQTVGSPSTARLALSIGATATRDLIQRQYQAPGMGTALEEPDFMLYFSSRGPTAAGGFKPNLTAPGTELSSVQLNAAPGSHSGLDVYWGTSMAAPAATGAYALFLDAVRKYNRTHPDHLLPTDSVTLRSVLLESARGFDVRTFNPVTGERRDGQYTWVDQGAGMISLPAAWVTLKKLAETSSTSAITQAGRPVEVDYTVYTSQSATDSPSGNAYDGTRMGDRERPAFGEGLYLSYTGTESLRQVYIARRLSDATLQSDADLGELNRQLVTSADTFELKTVIHGSNVEWLKAGTLNALDCWNSGTADLTVLGTGIDLMPVEGGAALNPGGASALSVCLNRARIENELAAGDHGALIYAYRKATRVAEDGRSETITSPVASFIIPVYLKVPHRILENKTGYEISGTVRSFGLNRHSVRVPSGVSLVRVQLEVAEARTTGRGRLADDEHCSGVELMATLGKNTLKPPFKKRQEARAANCDGEGRPNPVGVPRKVDFVIENPTAGTWDLHVFGQNRFAQSDYRLRVDYAVARTNPERIEGSLQALNGRFEWKLLDASQETSPSAERSSYELNGLERVQAFPVLNQQTAWAPAIDGTPFHTYEPSKVSFVRVSTAGFVLNRTAMNNDVDLGILGCPENSASVTDPRCAMVKVAATDSDQETAVFKPVVGVKYAFRVDGYQINDRDYQVRLTETLGLEAEAGTLEFSGRLPVLTVAYRFGADAQAGSAILKSPQYLEQRYRALATIRLKDEAGVPLSVLPLTILPPAPSFSDDLFL